MTVETVCHRVREVHSSAPAGGRGDASMERTSTPAATRFAPPGLRRGHALLFVATLLFAACSGDGSSTPAAASFRALGVLRGDARSYAFGVSSSGNVVIGASYDAQEIGQAFRWTEREGMVGLGSLPDRPNSQASAASADGSVVGGTSVFIDLFDAFRWTAAGGIEKLRVGATDPPPEAVNGVSGDGTVLVGAANFAFADPVAFRWTEAGGLEQLGFLSGGTGASEAFGISDDGSVIVGQSTQGDTDVAFRWTASGGVTALALPSGTLAAIAFAVSADGGTAVGSSNTAPRIFQATRWGSGASATVLPALAGGQQTSVARAVSSGGTVIVGQVTLEGGEQVAVVWDEGGARQLRDILTAAGLADQLDGWALEDAQGVSADGMLVAGSATSPDGVQQAFLARLP
jgi:probable HAF family extracellular repeat protein